MSKRTAVRSSSKDFKVLRLALVPASILTGVVSGLSMIAITISNAVG